MAMRCCSLLACGVLLACGPRDGGSRGTEDSTAEAGEATSVGTVSGTPGTSSAEVDSTAGLELVFERQTEQSFELLVLDFSPP